MGEAGRTKKNYRMTLAELLRYAKQRRYVVDNPIEELTAEDVKNLEGRGYRASSPPSCRQPMRRSLIIGGGVRQS